MTDEATQRLARGGCTVALLTARLRDGSLTRSMLELAAYCGNEAAREVVMGHSGRDAIHDSRVGGNGCRQATTEDGRYTKHTAGEFCAFRDFSTWIRGLDRWGGEALRVGEEALDVLRYDKPWPQCPWPLPGFAAATARDLGEQPTRAAVQAALISWALQGSQLAQDRG